MLREHPAELAEPVAARVTQADRDHHCVRFGGQRQRVGDLGGRRRVDDHDVGEIESASKNRRTRAPSIRSMSSAFSGLAGRTERPSTSGSGYEQRREA